MLQSPTGSAMSKAKSRPRCPEAQPQRPTGPFSIIVADPPWKHGQRAAALSYRGMRTMSTKAICSLAVARIAAEDAILWLWISDAHLVKDAGLVLKAWGFEHKATLVWVKDRVDIGEWLQQQTELCLLAVRGTPVVKRWNATTVLMAKARDATGKPKEFYELVESYSSGSKLDLFGCDRRAGWVSWSPEPMPLHDNNAD